MTESMMTVNNTQYLNPTLQKITDKIRVLDMSIRAHQYRIAYLMAKVESEQLYQQDGYDSAVAWAENAFGIKKTIAYSLITVGRDYTREIRGDNNRLIGYCSNLVDMPDSPDMPVIDYTPNQLGRLSTLGYNAVKTAHDNGDINPRMTTVELRDYIKACKALKAGNSEQPADQPAEQPAEQPETTVEYIGYRDDGIWDNIPTCQLFAELCARGITIAHNDIIYNWGSGE